MLSALNKVQVRGSDTLEGWYVLYRVHYLQEIIMLFLTPPPPITV